MTAAWRRSLRCRAATLPLLLLACLLSRSASVPLRGDARAGFGPVDPPAAWTRAAIAKRAATGDSSLPERFSKIIMLQDPKDARKAEAMCAGDAKVLQTLGEDEADISGCLLPDVCHRVYSQLAGFAGHFTDAQIESIRKCFRGRITVLEDDIKVVKTEHDYTKPIRPVRGRGLRQAASGGSGGEGPNNNPALLALSNSFQADASSVIAAGFQSAYFNASAHTGPTGDFSTGFKVQQLHPSQWNLDRIDQNTLPLDRQFGFGGLRNPGTGKGVTIYVVDSGIRKSHQEFTSWSGGESRASYGYNFADSNAEAEDCDGHGTHVSSTAVGRTVGVAKEARVVAVRVLNCQGSGTVSNVVAGLNWVAQNAVAPAVVTMSLGVPQGQWSDALNQAVVSLIETYRVTAVVAAGNSKVDSCTIAPANVREAITVAAVDLSKKFSGDTSRSRDEIYSWDNTGNCVSVFAPGVDILAACGGTARCAQLNDATYTWASGTSMAVPHAAGLAAIFLGNNRNATPADVKGAIVNGATVGAVNLGSPTVLPGTPNRLINTLATGSQGVLVTATDGPG